MSNQIIRNTTMPNVYIQTIRVNEYSNKIIVKLTLACANSAEDNWRVAFLLPYMKINASILVAPNLSSRPLTLTHGEESNNIKSINHIIDGESLIPAQPPHCIDKPAAENFAVDVIDGIEYYKYMYSFTINRPDDIDLNDIYAFAWSSVDLKKLEINENADFAMTRKKILRGPLKCEAIKKSGVLVQSTNFYRVDSTQELWPGPVYIDDDENIRGGAYDGSMENAPLLQKYTKHNSKIVYNDRTDRSFIGKLLVPTPITTKETTKPQTRPQAQRVRAPFGSGIRVKPTWLPSILKNKILKPGFVPSPLKRRAEKMRKPQIPKVLAKPDSVPSIFEMGMTLDMNDDLQNVFVVDLANLSQNKSYVGDLIYKVDPILHSQISNSLEIDDITINRSLLQPRLQSHRFGNFSNNQLNIKKFKNRSKLPSNKNLNNIESMFNNVELLHTSNANFKLKKKTFFRKRNVIDFGLTAEKTKIASIEQIDIGMQNKMRAIQFTDHEVDKLSKGEYSYSLTIKCKDKFVEYVKNLLLDIDAFRTKLFEYHQHVVKSKLYDYEALKFKEKYIRSFFRSHGIEYNNQEISLTNIDSSSLRQSFFIRGCNKLNRACQLTLTPFFNDIFLKKVIPTLSSPDTILNAIKEIDDVYRLVEKFYNIRPTKDGAASIGSKNSNIKNQITFKHRFQNTHVVNPKKKIKYRFIKFNKKRPLRLKKSQFKRRANREVSKYFSGSPSRKSLSLAGVSNAKINSLTNIQRNSYLHFTPEEIKVGRMTLDNTSLSNSFKNNDTYNLLQLSRFIQDFDNEDEIEKQAIKLEKVRNKLNLIDAVDFLGEGSPSVTNLINLINQKPEKLLKNKKSLRQINLAMASSKIQKRVPNKLDLFDVNKKDNIFMKSLRKKNFDSKKMPIQLRSLMFSRSPMVKNKIFEKGFDIFSNPLTSEMAFQNFINIKKVQYLDGFEVDANGINLMNKPIFKDMDDVNYNSIAGKSKLCKLVSGFNNSLFKPQSEDFSSEGEVFLLEDDNTAEDSAPQGITTMNAGHHHAYNVDENGNGYTEYAVHPENENIRHRHQIINNVIQVAASECYPNCNDLYGVDGAMPHLHKYITDNAQLTSANYVDRDPSDDISSEDSNMTSEATIMITETAAFAKNLFSSTVELKQNKNFNSVERILITPIIIQADLPLGDMDDSTNASSPADVISGQAMSMSLGGGGGSGGY